MKRLLYEPLFHFLLIGAALFGLYGLMSSGQHAAASSKEIRLSLSEITQLTQLYQSQWRRPPTPEEFGRMVENKVQEEVLYREAVAMGLDKDDTIVKRRMAQKMRFLAEDVGGGACSRRAPSSKPGMRRTPASSPSRVASISVRSISRRTGAVRWRAMMP
jgi:hypothetical protein